jgi:hypothetical protein
MVELYEKTGQIAQVPVDEERRIYRILTKVTM